MSCIKCEEFQESKNTSFIRWKNANIEVRGCVEHLREVFSVIRSAQSKKQSDLLPFKHGEEGTHYACQQMIKKLGGQAGCCGCNGHKCII